MNQLGSPYPADQVNREALVLELGADDTFAALDERFYELEAGTNADAVLSALLQEGA